MSTTGSPTTNSTCGEQRAGPQPPRRCAMLVVIAIGGKALCDPEGALKADAQRAGTRAAVAAIAGVARQHQVVVTHGSGSQVGLLAYQSVLSRHGAESPL